jgi:beta-hydroxyacyl-ACP dehydratase FabZ
MLSAADIARILPHQPPLLMVDEVSVLDDERIVAHKLVRADEPNVRAHYPANPLMPGVLIVEGMAQAGGLLAYHLGDFDPAQELLLFMGIEQARFRRPVRPGERLRYEVRPLRRGSIYKLSGVALVDEAVAAEATLLAAIRPRESV